MRGCEQSALSADLARITQHQVYRFAHATFGEVDAKTGLRSSQTDLEQIILLQDYLLDFLAVDENLPVQRLEVEAAALLDEGDLRVSLDDITKKPRGEANVGLG